MRVVQIGEERRHTLPRLGSDRGRAPRSVRLVGLGRPPPALSPRECGQRSESASHRPRLDPGPSCRRGVSALDVSIQARWSSCSSSLQQLLKLTYLFIAPIAAVENICALRGDVSGEDVEMGDTRAFFDAPTHPTRGRAHAIPRWIRTRSGSESNGSGEFRIEKRRCGRLPPATGPRSRRAPRRRAHVLSRPVAPWMPAGRTPRFRFVRDG